MNEGTTMERVGLEPIGECTVLHDVHAQPGIVTIEGTMMPLLTGEQLRSHMIVMHAGQYCDAHPHETESIIYTISGRWVFCTEDGDGNQLRTVIGPNDLFHFPGGVATGFETPFDEDASILIVKSGSESYEELAAGIQGAKEHLDEEHAKGVPFYFKELPDDHPAREFARQVAGRDPGAVVE